MADMVRADFAEFTETGYREVLERTADAYEFVRFDANPPARPHVLWRHDIDVSPHRALRMAAIEAEHGIVATYFVMLHSPFYNALEAEIRAKLSAIAGLGHAIGLHFDLSFHFSVGDPSGIETYLRSERQLLEDLVGAPVTALSLHNPEIGNALQHDAERYAGMVNAYSRRLTRDYTYVSDSNGYWRFRPLREVIEEAPSRLHVLTHPEWWTPTAMSPRARMARAVEGRAHAVLAEYDSFLDLAGRRNIR